MMRTTDMDSTGPFWRFSLQFYALPGVASTLLRLQDSYNLDVNIILYACFRALNGKDCLTGDQLHQLHQSVGRLRHSAVLPVRRIRRRLGLLKDQTAAASRLYERLKVLELRAEFAAQADIACHGCEYESQSGANRPVEEAITQSLLGYAHRLGVSADKSLSDMVARCAQSCARRVEQGRK